MKKRHIFIIGLIALLLACPSCMIYITVKQQESYKKKVINGIDPYRIQLLSMAVESKTNPDYSPLIFNGTDELGQEAANDAINKIFDALLEMEQSDDGFYYIAYNTKTKQYYKNEKSHYPVIYKQTSTIAKDQKFNDFNLREILEDTEIVHRLDDNYKLMDDGRLKVKDVYINLDQITINPPNIELTYYCTVYVSPMTNNISHFIDEYDVGVLAGIASLLGLILFIYIIMNSLEVEESINPYRTIKNWKLLTVLILIGLTCFVFIGVSTGTGIFVITGELQNVLARHGVAYGTSISYGLYFFSMFIFYFLFSMLCFTVKYMFMNGMNYFKNNTCTYALYEKTKELGNRVTEFDLKDNINQDILKFTICNALLVIVLYVLSPSKTIFAIVYVMISFLYIRKQSMKVKNDYKNMLNFTEQLSHGHFDTEIEDDLGIFNSMRDRLNNLKTGFEAAVKEETKSQNMKTELKISEKPLSVSYVGIQQLKDVFGIAGKKALVIGSGKTAVLALRYLYEYEIAAVTVCSRTFAHARELLEEFPGVEIVPYEKRYEKMKDCDIVVSATASPHAGGDERVAECDRSGCNDRIAAAEV